MQQNTTEDEYTTTHPSPEQKNQHSEATKARGKKKKCATNTATLNIYTVYIPYPKKNNFVLSGCGSDIFFCWYRLRSF